MDKIFKIERLLVGSLEDSAKSSEDPTMIRLLCFIADKLIDIHEELRKGGQDE